MQFAEVSHRIGENPEALTLRVKPYPVTHLSVLPSGVRSKKGQDHLKIYKNLKIYTKFTYIHPPPETYEKQNTFPGGLCLSQALNLTQRKHYSMGIHNRKSAKSLWGMI